LRHDDGEDDGSPAYELDVNGGRVAVTTERPGLWRWKGFIKHGPDDAVKAVHEARKTRGRI